ncbi:hypothetical protein R3P38DRAFT_2826089 [Favolaschia claudopus]|uniref:Uncharacterized protein n=1 Tax=Favolaschia claudopus TaxID=2862362 RepID=A0AAW0EJ75_9AGAR
MPPKPRPLHRKASVSKAATAAAASSDPVKSQQDAAKSMPPPPDPLPPGILIPEVTALSACLKNAVVKTGQLYGFYADTRRLLIQNYAPAPPQSLTAGLGRELEKYDQLCDSIESQLLRAISVLQRDLGREERRIKEAEAEAEAKANSIAGRTRSASRSPTSTRTALPPMEVTTNMEGSPPPVADPAMSPTLSNSSIAGRRPSAISISSLQRPNLPLKLDLSSSALRITAEEASLFSQGLASPVTLAPRSARPYGPNELPPEIMAALASASATADPQPRPVDIDLTGADNPAPDVDMATIGNTADKPIELDLDAMEIDRAMSDLFGDTADSNSNAGDGLFTPVVPVPDIAHTLGGADGTNIKVEEESFLNALSGDGEDVFASLRGSHGPQAAPGSAGPPPSILASFSQQMGEGTSDAANQPGGSNPTSYDLESLDLTNLGAGFFENAEHTDMNADMNIFDMEELLSMGGEEENGHGGQTTGTNGNATTETVLDPAVKTEHYVPGLGI